MPDEKDTLKRYLQAQRDGLRWKLDGLGERDARWPMTTTGTNLLGLVKHVGSMEYDYFGLVFDRPKPEPMPWLEDDAEVNADLWATAEQSIEWVLAFYDRAVAHADATIDALALDDTGSVPWWPEDRRQVTLHQILVHMIAETARHAGHADIVREQIDGTAGLRPGNSNLPDQDAQRWADYVEKLKRLAEEAGAKG
ncbi:DinB family protein [Jiangella mangrovi]|uniref:Putative damage-inducible protein DinB n=1 Tax=Jiangella mangrovi TaxID=1524084 RepID=A0A7W9GLC8_9ACTN|nr:DinB family protein [Jiangella mangrovi]MBB5785973.1 putative damage-inducible protein DinB [Jiangella mangrovi]